MRAFGWFVAAFVLAGVIAAVLGYPIYGVTSSFAHWPFHRVTGRIAMLALLLELIWLCRFLDLRSKRDLGYGLPWRRFVQVALSFGALGMMSAALGAAFLLSSGLRVREPDFIPSLASYLRIFAVGLGSGMAVALLEETVFRGAMHTAIARETSGWNAALLTAPLFAILHFFAKVHIPVQELHWGSGFDLLARSFAPLGHPGLVFDSFLSWLLIGLILSGTRMLTGNIAVSIGLHAGWVVVLRMLQESTHSGSSPGYSQWVGQFDGLLGYWLLPWGIAIAIALWLTRAVWVPRASVGRLGQWT